MIEVGRFSEEFQLFPVGNWFVLESRRSRGGGNHYDDTNTVPDCAVSSTKMYAYSSRIRMIEQRLRDGKSLF